MSLGLKGVQLCPIPRRMLTHDAGERPRACPSKPDSGPTRMRGDEGYRGRGGKEAHISSR